MKIAQRDKKFDTLLSRNGGLMIKILVVKAATLLFVHAFFLQRRHANNEFRGYFSFRAGKLKGLKHVTS